MTIHDALAALVSAAPSDATVPVRWIKELLAANSQTAKPGSDGGVDLTVREVATRFGRGESTIRTWLARGELEGAYRLHGREWRIPLASIDRLQRAQARPAVAPPPRHRARGSPDIGEWRKHLDAGSTAGRSLDGK